MSEQMIFCVGDGAGESKGKGFQKNLQIFNVSVTEDEYERVKKSLDIKNFKLPVAKWIDIKEIKSPTSTQKQLGGYLKELSYKEAWKELWSTLNYEDRMFFKSLPHFNSEIFEAITRIKIEESVSLKGRKMKVELDGQSYEAIIQ